MRRELNSNIISLQQYKEQKYLTKCVWCDTLVNTRGMKGGAFICYNTGAHLEFTKVPDWVDDLRANGIVIFDKRRT